MLLNQRRAKLAAIQQKDADVIVLLQGDALRDQSEEGILKLDAVLTELSKARAEYVAEKLPFPEGMVEKATAALVTARATQSRVAEGGAGRAGGAGWAEH